MLKGQFNKYLFFVCILVVGFLIFDLSKNKADKIKITGLLQSDFASNLDAIDIGDFLTIQKYENTWQVTKPYKDWVNKTRLEDLVSVFVDGQYEEINLSDGEKKQIFQDSYRVVFYALKMKREFQVGSITQFENKSYVLENESQKMYLTDSPVREKVGLGPENYRLKQIVKGHFDDVIGMTFKSAKKIKTYKHTEELWKKAAFKSQLNSLFYTFYQKNIDQTLFHQLSKKMIFQIEWLFVNNQKKVVVFYEEVMPSVNKYAVVDQQIYLLSDRDYQEFLNFSDREKSLK